MCWYCKREMDPPDAKSKLRATLEHVYPRGHQLRGSPFSLRAACWECNNRLGVLNSPKFLLPPICGKRQVGWFASNPFWLPQWFHDVT